MSAGGQVPVYNQPGFYSNIYGNYSHGKQMSY